MQVYGRGRGGLVSGATVMTDASLIAMRREIRAAARRWLLALGTHCSYPLQNNLEIIIMPVEVLVWLDA